MVYGRIRHEKARNMENLYYLLGSVESAQEGLITIPNSLRDAEQPARLWYLPDDE